MNTHDHSYVLSLILSLYLTNTESQRKKQTGEPTCSLFQLERHKQPTTVPGSVPRSPVRQAAEGTHFGTQRPPHRSHTSTAMAYLSACRQHASAPTVSLLLMVHSAGGGRFQSLRFLVVKCHRRKTIHCLHSSGAHPSLL